MYKKKTTQKKPCISNFETINCVLTITSKGHACMENDTKANLQREAVCVHRSQTARGSYKVYADASWAESSHTVLTWRQIHQRQEVTIKMQQVNLKSTAISHVDYAGFKSHQKLIYIGGRKTKNDRQIVSRKGNLMSPMAASIEWPGTEGVCSGEITQNGYADWLVHSSWSPGNHTRQQMCENRGNQ